MEKTLYFASNTSKNKFPEIKKLFGAFPEGRFHLKEYPDKLDIIQSNDIEKVAVSKVLDAYKKICRPVFAEHTGLRLKEYGDLPNGQTGIMWNAIKDHLPEEDKKGNRTEINKKAAIRFCELFHGQRASVVCVLTYCDGVKIHRYEKDIKGTIAKKPNGSTDYGWDSVFCPDGAENKTLGQLQDEGRKEDFFPRKAVMDDFKNFLMNVENLSMLSAAVPDGQESAINSLKEQLKARKVILFIGSGVSRNLSLPSWNSLIENLNPYLSEETRSSDDYMSDVLFSHVSNNNPALAEYCRNGYFSSSNYSDNNDRYIDWKNAAAERMRKEWSEEIIQKKLEDKNASSIYTNLQKLDCPYIYTTNYDHCLECAFDHSGIENKYMTIREFGDYKKLTHGKQAIFKFHGDTDVPQSMIITESDYFSRMALDTPMDLRLRSLMMEYSFLFLGYSLADYNLRYLFYRLDRLRRKAESDLEKQLGKNGESKIELPKSYILMSRPNRVEMSLLEQTFHITPLVSDTLEPGAALKEFLEELAGEIEERAAEK